MTNNFGIILTAINVSIALLAFIIARKKDDAQKTTKDVEQFVKVNLKLDELCRNTTDIKLDARMTTEKIESIIKTQVEHDTEIKNLSRRVDSLQEEVKNVQK